MSNKHSKTSFLKNAPTIDNLFLDVNKLPSVPANANDDDYVIGHGYDERPDLLAHALYGNSNLWWVFALRNPDTLKDPIRDFTSGKAIKVPSNETVKRII